ncbi:MAG TPA: HAMP domain-containing sensor histidine kinase [Actinophytocola sp.]|nr:HAMP domain-containing sensor histidine kinase [Actinophytocola sp.]
MVAALLLWLGWMLVGGAVSLPSLPAGTTVVVDGVRVRSEQLTEVLRDDARQRVLVGGSIAFVCVVFATAVLAWTFTGRVVKPLRDVTGTARRLSAESLGERISLRGPRDEVADLADTFDAMLDRLQATFNAQRQFVANASHELRTPLSVIRTELDVTLGDPDADAEELRRMAGVVRDATLRAGQLVEALLLLARTDGMGIGVVEPVDLAGVVAGAWQPNRADAARRGLTTAFHLPPTPAAGDPTLLDRVAGNLLENAVRHNVDGGWIDVRTDGGPEWVSLRVSSSGTVVDPSRVEELFESFRRGGVNRTAHSGTGLGLAIVRAVVLAHHGTVGAEAVSGGGLTVTVHLPTAARPAVRLP